MQVKADIQLALTAFMFSPALLETEAIVQRGVQRKGGCRAFLRSGGLVAKCNGRGSLRGLSSARNCCALVSLFLLCSFFGRTFCRLLFGRFLSCLFGGLLFGHLFLSSLLFRGSFARHF